MVDAGCPYTIWDQGYAFHKGIDVLKWAKLHYPSSVNFRVIAVQSGPNRPKLAYEYTAESKGALPVAAYPVWDALTDEMSTLRALVKKPVHLDKERRIKCNPDDPRRRPRIGQEHRVIIRNTTKLPHSTKNDVLNQIHDLQNEHPECIIHLYRTESKNKALSLSFRAFDLEFRTPASRGRVFLPNGKLVTIEEATEKWGHWIELMGTTPSQLKVPRERTIFGIRSIMWAAENYNKNIPYRVRKKTSNGKVHDSLVLDNYTPPKPKHELDMILCGSCTIQNTCKFFRAGSVCSVPNSEPAELAKYFNTRDSDRIIDGLGTLLATQSNRLQQGLQEEHLTGELDPEVTKIINTLFTNGVKLAKLVNPALGERGTQVSVSVGAGGQAAVVAGGSATQLTSRIVAELEAKGIPRDRITPEMIAGILDPQSESRIIETAAIEAGEL